MTLIPDIQMEILRRVSDSPSHGYQLHKEVGVATSTIYNHLDQLEAAGMVRSEQVKADSRDKTMYYITDGGEKLLCLLED